VAVRQTDFLDLLDLPQIIQNLVKTTDLDRLPVMHFDGTVYCRRHGRYLIFSDRSRLKVLRSNSLLSDTSSHPPSIFIRWQLSHALNRIRREVLIIVLLRDGPPGDVVFRQCKLMKFVNDGDLAEKNPCPTTI
jgi:hypothetical protein